MTGGRAGEGDGRSPDAVLASSEPSEGALPRAFLRPALHVALLGGASHGYELLVQLRGAGLASLDLGGVYRALRAMEHSGAVHSSWEASELGPARRVYELSESGREQALSSLAALSSARDHLDRLIGGGRGAAAATPRTAGPR